MLSFFTSKQQTVDQAQEQPQAHQPAGTSQMGKCPGPKTCPRFDFDFAPIFLPFNEGIDTKTFQHFTQLFLRIVHQ